MRAHTEHYKRRNRNCKYRKTYSCVWSQTEQLRGWQNRLHTEAVERKRFNIMECTDSFGSHREQVRGFCCYVGSQGLFPIVRMNGLIIMSAGFVNSY